MKIINLTVGNNPPVIRTSSKVYKAVCYKLLETKCDVDTTSYSNASNAKLKLRIWNETAPNQPYAVFDSDDTSIRYRLYDEGTFVRNGIVPYSENKFKVVIPPLAAGFYYLEVYGLGGYNKVMVNVT